MPHGRSSKWKGVTNDRQYLSPWQNDKLWHVSSSNKGRLVLHAILYRCVGKAYSNAYSPTERGLALPWDIRYCVNDACRHDQGTSVVCQSFVSPSLRSGVHAPYLSLSASILMFRPPPSLICEPRVGQPEIERQRHFRHIHWVRAGALVAGGTPGRCWIQHVSCPGDLGVLGGALHDRVSSDESGDVR